MFCKVIKFSSKVSEYIFRKGREYYHYATVLTLLRPMSKATLSMHCGRLSYSVAFREFIEYLTLLDSDASDTEVTFAISVIMCHHDSMSSKP